MFSFTQLSQWTPHSKAITCVKLNSDSSIAATSSADASIAISSLSSLSTPTVKARLTASDLSVEDSSLYGINSIDFSPHNNRYLVSGGDDGLVRLWDVEEQRCICTMPGHQSWILSTTFSPTGTLILSCSTDESLRLWDARSGKAVRVLRGHASVISCGTFSQDGTLIASGAGDGLIRVWDVLSGTCLQACMYEACPSVGSVQFSRNKAYVLGSFLDNNIRLVDIKKNSVERTYSGHVNSNYLVSSRFFTFKNVDDCVLSGSEDGQFFLWNSKTGNLIHRQQIFNSNLCSFDVSERSNLIVSGSLDEGVCKLCSW
ncbi:hypothetical protein RCL1_007018 [Eukaryota sp. TZLM3-RCL]